MADVNANISSSDDDMTSETDVEQFIISEERNVTEYYLGKKYFEFAITAQLLKTSAIGELWSELDVRQYRSVSTSLTKI